MGFIRMSSGFANTQNGYFIMAYTTGGALGTLLADYGFLHNNGSSNGQIMGRFCIMKGTVPATPPVNFNARGGDALLVFTSTGGSTGSPFTSTGTFANPAVITTNYVNASASGTATWFWILTVQQQAGAPDNTQNPPQQVWGTIGVTGSGADLVMSSTSIIAGQPYRIYNFRWQMPTSWTF